MDWDNAEGSSRSVAELSERQQSILVGTILGDGCLAKHGHYHRLHVKHKLAHRSLAELKLEAFRDFISMPLHKFDQRLGRARHPCVQFATRTNPVFTEWHSRFYQDGRKSVPDGIDELLSPLALTIWLMDDGAADYAGVTLQTHSFKELEVERLASAMRIRFRLAVTLRANKGGLILYVKACSLERLRSIVKPHLLDEFAYKLIARRTRTP